ncbi:MAG: HypC/HybG/HupF family hydrogenase formation chaperone [Actinomycetota bacterium]|nr:HypC/HybG/HupF family hydrogenase formation chaperone [Acidimicrobiia bacterium]MDQ3146986.1 HypC/HybG/HupF family hydrogenase formation chaperone [Actinomycetota bacterium]
MCLGLPGKIVVFDPEQPHRAVIDVDGVRREVNAELVAGDEGGIAVGDWVLVHVGFAMARIDEEEAVRSLAFIKELGSVYDDEIEQLQEGAGS